MTFVYMLKISSKAQKSKKFVDFNRIFFARNYAWIRKICNKYYVLSLLQMLLKHDLIKIIEILPMNLHFYI